MAMSLTPNRLPHLSPWLAAAMVALFTGCTTMPPASGVAAVTPVSRPASAPTGAVGPGGAASGARPPGAAPVAVPSGPLRPFADIVKEAKRIDGPIVAWQKDDKVWLELKPADLGRPFFLMSALKSGIGDGGFLGGLMQDSGIVEFRRIHNQIQLLWRNVEFFAPAGSAEARSIESTYSPSLLASAAVLSAPEPERKSILVEANALLMGDLLGLGMDLQRTYRQGYSFDPRNSAITGVRTGTGALEIDFLAHYATASISLPSPGLPPGVPQPSAPRTLPDPRSLFMQIHYSLAGLAPEPMKSRQADPRIGHFEIGRFDFGSDLARSPRQRMVQRWRLEKKDPLAPMSEPVQPIVFWIDRSVPERYRASVIAGVLEWNKAFERIGFKNAIRAEVVPENADFDTLDFGRASIRWMTNPPSGLLGIGPRRADPRSGEILGAVLLLESTGTRLRRAERTQVLSGLPAAGEIAASSHSSHGQGADALYCEAASGADEQAAYATDVLEARGDLDPDSPEAEGYVQAALKQVTMHEVGHTLGLRHNFRSSHAYSQAQLRDPEFVRANGITGSVMDYPAVNLNSPGEGRLTPEMAFGPSLGPYDYWAIEYAYRPFPAELSPEDEAAALRRIAARSAEPMLAFGTDEDVSIGIDPESLAFDLGNDPVAFAKRRIQIAQDLLRRQETRALKEGQDYAYLRRSVVYALNDVARAAGVLSRQIGATRTFRDYPGSGRDPLTPVSATDQRDALNLITGSLLSANGLRVSAALQRRLAVDFGERGDAFSGGFGSASTDYSPTVQILGMQRALLAVLMSDTVATRMLESAERAPAGADRALRMPELYARLSQAVWSDLDAGGDIAPLRREVQRDHVNRIAALLVRPGSASRADTRSVVRQQAKALFEKVRTASRRADLGEETRAHLADSADTLEQALNARLQRAGA